MKQLGEEMVLALKERLEQLKEIRDYVKQLLARFESERKEMSQQLQQMLEDYRQERVRTHETWQEVLEELRRVRESGRS
jgi:F0F1-type ATP synthase membrane subunit b/b'